MSNEFQMKKCSKCGVTKLIGEFYKHATGAYGVAGMCKSCKKIYRDKHKERFKKWYADYYEKNCEAKREQAKVRWANRTQEQVEAEQERVRKWRKDNAEYARKKRKAYYQKNQKRIIQQKKEYTRRKRAEDPYFRLKCSLRSRIRNAMFGISKSASTMELIGCSVEEYRAHLESQFTDGMTWENYGIGGWHIDHIKPCVSFDLTDPEQQKECFNYKNTRPLWAKDNIRKGGKYGQKPKR